MFSELLGRVTPDTSTEKPPESKFWDRVQTSNARLCIDVRVFRTDFTGSWCLSYIHTAGIRLSHARDVGRLLRHGGRLV